MRKLRIVVPVLLSLSLAASPVWADRGYYDHRGGGGGWGGLAVFGALTGAIIATEIVRNQQPIYVQPQPVYMTPYPVQPVYVGQSAATAMPPGPSANNWYYCQSSAMYYPYTQACPEGWLAVPSQPQ